MPEVYGFPEIRLDGKTVVGFDEFDIDKLKIEEGLVLSRILSITGIYDLLGYFCRYLH